MNRSMSFDTMGYVSLDLLGSIGTFDLALTTYECLRDKHFQSKLRKFNWHRIVLDECQEVKCSTSLIAKQCADLKASYRWMISGTPLVNRIEDLNGELQFLKIWPFSLSDLEDGFWQMKIGDPFRNKDESSLELLYALIDVVMMRHSKSQRYIEDNRKLVVIPQRTIEWRPVPLLSDYEKYLLTYLEKVAVEGFCYFMTYIRGDLSNDNIVNLPHYAQLKCLYHVISKSLTHTRALSLAQLDHLQRLLSRSIFLNVMRAANHKHVIPAMTAEAALAILQSGALDVGGGLSRDSNRVLTSTTYGQKDLELREKYHGMSLIELT